MIALVVLANASDGSGDSSVACKNLPRIIGFLASAEHRTAIILMAALYKPHLHRLAFVNSYSETRDATIISTRVLESPVENRNILEEAVALSHNWRALLPTTSQDIDRIMLDSTTDDIETSKATWNRSIGSAFQNNLDVSLKYFRDIDLEIGWSLIWIVDPILAPSVASAILEGLKQCELISNCVYPPMPPIEHVNNNNAVWTIDSTTHVFPGMSFKTLYETILAKYTANAIVTRAVALAYGLMDQRIIEDLCKLARGELRIRLESTVYLEDWR